jgi:hypothetical protein
MMNEVKPGELKQKQDVKSNYENEIIELNSNIEKIETELSKAQIEYVTHDEK